MLNTPRRILLFLVLIGQYEAAIAQSWSPQVSGVNVHLQDLHMLSAQSGFAVGNSGAVLRTLDGGMTWQTLASMPAKNLNDIHFSKSSPSRGWICGNNTLLRTANGGSSWTEAVPPNSQIFYGVHFQTNLKGWVVGAGANTYRSDDGGLTLSPFDAIGGSGPDLRKVFFTDTDRGWVIGNTGRIFRTDNGSSDFNVQWVNKGDPIYGSLRDIHFISKDTGWVVGFRNNPPNGVVLRTTNGGDTWQASDIPDVSSLQGVYFINNTQGWTVGWNGAIYRTEDGGVTWIKEDSGITTPLLSVFFLNGELGWAVGQNGRILKYVNDPSYLITANVPCRGDTLFLAVNGNPGDSYLWSGPNGFGSTLRDPVIPNVQHGGTYSVTVTRPSGATVTVSVQVTLKEGPQVSLSNLGPVPCGTIGRTVSASSQPAGASFVWFDAQDNLLGTGNSHNFQQSGTYRIRATRDGCSTDSIFVLPPSGDGPAISLSLSGALLTCLVDSIFAQVQVGGNWSVAWTLGGQPWAQTATTYLTQAGTYQLRVTDMQTQCFRDTSVVISANRVSPQIGDLDVPVMDCTGAPGILQLLAPQAGLDYRWYRNGQVIGTGAGVTVQQAGDYRLVVTDPQNGCSAERLVQVPGDLTPPQIGGFQIVAEDCAQGVFSLDALVQPPVQAWSWSHGGVFLSAVERITPLQPGIYALTVTGLNGCTASSMREVTSSELTATGTVNHRLEWLDCASGRARIRLTLEGKPGEVSWRDPMGGVMGSGASIEVSTSGTFTAWIVWEGGCETTYPVTVPSVAEDLLPTVITPNGDGDNDRLVFDLCSPGSTGPVRLTVFNRWGYVVYRNEDYRGDWPASSADAPSPGQYYYILRVGDQDWRRTLTVLR